MKPAFHQKAFLLLFITSLFSNFSFSQVAYVSYGSTWKYLDTNTRPPGWETSGFADGSWASGPSMFGYGDSNVNTTVSYGGDANNKYITTYFRKSISITNPADFTDFTLNVYRDDGFVLYVNGTEVQRNNLPGGTIVHGTLASNATDGGDVIQTYTIPSSAFSVGTNVLAVEVHQTNATSSDLVFDMELIGNIAPVSVIAYGASWKYLDNGSNQGTAWQGTGFNDASWKTGNAKFGYGDAATTVVYSGCPPSNYPGAENPSPPDCGTKYITTYFRKTFNITGLSTYASFTFNVVRDDGYVIYINGNEVGRDNMPGGTITYTTGATTGLGAPAETTPVTFNVSSCSGYFVEGNNTIAVEIHQNNGGSTDLGFNLELIGNKTVGGTPTLTRGPYLQVGSETGITFRWRTNTACYGRVKVGPSNGTYTTATVDETCPTTEHIVRVTGLTADTKYFYEVSATDGTILQGAADNFFTTNPPANTTRKIKVIAFGDCGRGDVGRQNDNLSVYQNFLTTNGIDAPDAWILMGDNAYFQGTDAQYTTNFFGIYGSTLLKNHKLYPAPGNHDYANSSTNKSSRAMTYHQIFSVPQNGESGGVASNHQNYYSYNVGNIHFLSLDSYGTESDGTSIETAGGSALKTWVDADLAANTSKWTVAYWHHPPYTKGSHNSDLEGDLINIRQNFITYLESRGVDMIICGHTHVYERGYLVKNYTGTWGSFTPGTHAVSTSSATYTSNSTCPYVYNSTPANHGTVYVVEGSTGAGGGTNSGFASGPMPFAVNDGGMFYFEVEDNRLDAKMLRRDGTIFDRFTIIKDANKVTNYSIANGASQLLTASWPKTGNYTWTNTAGTGRTVNVTPPNNSTTNYTVTDEYGCVTDQFSVTTSGTLPVSILKYDVVLQNKTVTVSWSTSTEANNDYFTIERSANGVDFTAIGTVDGAGNSNETKNYSFIDGQPLPGTSFYRLSQTNFDAQKQYVGVKRIDNRNINTFDVKVLSGYTGRLVLQITSETPGKYNVKVFDLAGRKWSDEQVNVAAGTSRKEVSLNAGVYIWEVRNEKGEALHEKVVVK